MNTNVETGNKKRMIDLQRKIEVNRLESIALQLEEEKKSDPTKVEDWAVVSTLKARLSRVKGMSFSVVMVDDEINTIIITRNKLK